MKKLLFLFVAMMLFLVACGDNSASDEESDNTSSTEIEEASAEETEQEESDAGAESDKKEQIDEVSDSYLDTGDYIYEIKEIEQLNGRFDDGTQVLAIEMTFTNNSDEPKSAWSSLGISAEQETDTTVESLNGGNSYLPENYKPDLAELWMTDIKPGATVDVVIAFEILYPGNPVRLYDRFGDLNGNSTFERIVETE